LVIISSKHLWFFEVIEKECELPITRLENVISENVIAVLVLKKSRSI